MDVGQRVRVQLVELLLVPDAAEQPDPVIARRECVDARDVFAGVGRSANDDERTPGSAAQVALDGQIDVVLRFEPRHDQVIATRLEVEISQPVASRVDQYRCAIADQVGARTELALVVVSDALRVGDQGVGPADGESLGGAVVPATGTAPLGALPLKSVDVGGGRHSA